MTERRRPDIRAIGDGAEEIRRPDPPEPPIAGFDDDDGPSDGDIFLPSQCAVTPLGVNGRMYFFLDASQQLISLEANEIGRSRIVALWGSRFRQLYDLYPRISKEGDVVGFRPEIVNERLVATCHKRGVWDATERERGRGAWRGDNGELILHCGDVVLIFDKSGEGWAQCEEHTPGLIGRYVYPSAERSPQPAPERAIAGPDGPGNQALQMIASWSWRRGEIDAVLLLGWIGAAMLGGALDWRPVMWLTGGRGTGKSTLQKLLELLFDDAALSVSDASAAGIWQTLMHSTLPVLFDELEAEEDNRRGNGIVKLARQAASGGQVLRGGADHKSSGFTLRSSMLFSSILIPPLLGQDRSRLAIGELGELAHGTAPPDLDAKRWRKIGGALRRRLVDGWARFPRTLEFYRASLAAAGHSARGCDQFGTLLACADLLLNDADPDSDSADAWVSKLQAADMAEWEDDDRDEELALQRLLTSVIDVYRNGTRESVGAWVAQAAGPDGDVVEANRVLGTYGMKVTPLRAKDGTLLPQHLAISNNHQGLAQLFDKTHWAGKSGTMGVWVQAFRRLPGAERSPKAMFFAGTVSKATLVPLELALHKEGAG